MPDLRELERAATKGPWGAWIEGKREPFGIKIAWGGSPLVVTSSGNAAIAGGGGDISETDAALIAASRNALPLLLDVVDAARLLVFRDYRTNKTEAEGLEEGLMECIAQLDAYERGEP